MDGVPHEPAADEASVLVDGPGDEPPVEVGDPVPEADLVVQGPLGVQPQDIAHDLDGPFPGSALEQVVAEKREAGCGLGVDLDRQGSMTSHINELGSENV